VASLSRASCCPDLCSRSVGRREFTPFVPFPATLHPRYQLEPSMASPDVVHQVPTPRGASGTAASLPPSASRMAHSRQMSLLSMTTLATSQSHHPSEPLLYGAEHHDAHSRRPLHPDASYVATWLTGSFGSIPDVCFLGRRTGAIGRVSMCAAGVDGVCLAACCCRSWVCSPPLADVTLGAEV